MIIYLQRRLTLSVAALLLVLFGIVLGRYGGPAVRTVTAVVSGRLVPIYKVDTAEKKIALSFDATWGTDQTDELLDLFDRHGMKTTFFLAGHWIEKHPDYVRKIFERGHEIGTHSYAHGHMNEMSKEAILADLEKNHNLLKDITGVDPELFRPPFGEYSNKVIEAAESMGYYTIQWSIDSLDWKDVSADFMVRRVLQNLNPGEIVLFHNAGKHTPEAVAILIPELKARGYEIVPVGELIYRDDYVIEPHSGVQKPRQRSSKGSPTVTETAQIPEGAVFSVPEAQGAVSFMINVDWGEEHLPRILDLFASRGVLATFFVTGRWAERNPTLILAMADAGHEIANHGYSHGHPKQMTEVQLTEHIVKNQELLRQLTGGRVAALYTPPYGEWDARIVAHARRLGFYTILWTLDTVDWQDPTPETIYQRIAPRLASGAIVLMHPRANTVEALPRLIDAAEARGLKVVPVGTLLRSGGILQDV